ncbi:hypothetical protein EVB78_125 [Rhizobium phage RHph_N1_15]|nr:hypothetical protein EVB77_125 [Rhizobium phage RHph_N1_10]QIG69327.1 hypothetical protein EVB78_125 [Rhizobium phage RHph_N1_15]QIG75187.1 hypothetical protein EVC15_125 [Rhizobium phage RHph_N2_6]
MKTIPFAPGVLALLEHNVLMRVDRLTDDGGFHFTCMNGGWGGHWKDGVVTVEGVSMSDVKATIVSMAQPPRSLSHYNEIMPWMREHADEDHPFREDDLVAQDDEEVPY